MGSKVDVAILMPIRDMDRAIKFYTKRLGAKLQYRGQDEMKDMWASVTLGKQEFWLVAPEKREKRDLAYTVFQVKNIKAYVKELTKAGVKFEKAEAMSKDAKIEGPIAWEMYGANASLKDSEGNLLMLWQNAIPM